MAHESETASPDIDCLLRLSRELQSTIREAIDRWFNDLDSPSQLLVGPFVSTFFANEQTHVGIFSELARVQSGDSTTAEETRVLSALVDNDSALTASLNQLKGLVRYTSSDESAHTVASQSKKEDATSSRWNFALNMPVAPRVQMYGEDIEAERIASRVYRDTFTSLQSYADPQLALFGETYVIAWSPETDVSGKVKYEVLSIVGPDGEIMPSNRADTEEKQIGPEEKLVQPQQD